MIHRINTGPERQQVAVAQR